MRVDYKEAFPKGFEAMLALEGALHKSGLEPLLLELVKLRASQLNGCAHCLDMHSKDARARGEAAHPCRLARGSVLQCSRACGARLV